ncbi:MAG: prepilin peptidase, partial [Limnochordia bacterium]
MGMVFFVLGLVFGSFINVLIWRIPRRESIVFPGSHCPDCGKTLSARELIPV